MNLLILFIKYLYIDLILSLMESKKISDRLFKFNEDHSINVNTYGNLDVNNHYTNNKLLSVREKTLLQLRKNNLDEKIMISRFNSLAKCRQESNSSSRKYVDLEIKLSDSDIKNFINVKELESEFNLYDDKEELIKFFITQYLEFKENYRISNNPILNQNISKYFALYQNNNLFNNQRNSDSENVLFAFAKFTVLKLRELSITWEKINDEGIDFDLELYKVLLKFLFTTQDTKIQVKFLNFNFKV